MQTSTPRLVIGRRQALAVVAYLGVVIGLLAISLVLVADLRDKKAEVEAAQMRLDQLSERSRLSSAASITPNATVSGSPFLDGRTITVAGAALQQRVEAAVAKAGGALMSSQVELDGPDAKNGFINLTASMEVSQPAPCRRSFTTSRRECHTFLLTSFRSSRLRSSGSRRAGACE